MPVLNRISAEAPLLTEWRRDLHAHPELGLEEHRTSQFVADKLESWGITVTRGIAGTGVVGTLRVGSSGRSIGIRADMDALPIVEATGLPYASQNAGVMHACGHDGHTTMLLGAAKYLAETRNFDGTVHFIFQPAEENAGGGRLMVEDGLFQRFPCDMVFAAHNDTALPLGSVSAVEGPVSAASDRFTITLAGKGGHAATPSRSIDPVVVGAHVVVALQSVVSRRTSPLDNAVLSITQFHAGSAFNIIPDSAMLAGTVRTLRPEVQAEVEALISQIAVNTAAAHGVTATVEYRRGYPAVINAAEPTERAALAAGRVLGQAQVIRQRPTGMGGEDFSFMAQQVPGCFVRIGQVQGTAFTTGLHHPAYDFNDEILPIGASIWATLVEQELPRG